MAYGGRDFDVVDPTTDKVYSIDFINDLQDGEAITQATPFLNVRIGADSNPSSHLGDSQVDGTVVSTRIVNLNVGVTYNYGAMVLTSFGNTLVLYFGIPCQADFG